MSHGPCDAKIPRAFPKFQAKQVKASEIVSWIHIESFQLLSIMRDRETGQLCVIVKRTRAVTNNHHQLSAIVK